MTHFNSSIKTAIIIGTATLGSGALFTPALAQSNTGATLYQHCNYGGYAVPLKTGNANYGDLISKGAKNDDVSSIKVAPGYKIEIFRDANYQGPSKSFDKNVSCLVSHQMNDYLSSVKVSKVPGTGPNVVTANTKEQQCYNMVAGKVAWNREGDKQWDPKNIRDLCQGTTNPAQTVSCFKGGIAHRTPWRAATKDCKTSGVTHSYLTGVQHSDGSLMTSHFITGKNVSAAYVANGRFEETKDNSKTWKEYDKKGKAVFTFKETGRDDWSVYMKDESRNVRLQIDVHRKMVRVNEGSGMRDLYKVDHFSEFHG